MLVLAFGGRFSNPKLSTCHLDNGQLDFHNLAVLKVLEYLHDFYAFIVCNYNVPLHVSRSIFV